jgi:diketogulonate reductase-like aldo/keto reductase
LETAYSLCDGHLLTNQVKFSYVEPSPEKNGVLEYCQKKGIFLTAHEPLGKGRIPSHPPALLQEIGEKHGITAAQAALAWLLHKPMVITIPKSSNAEHLKQNLEAAEVVLDQEDLQRLEV